MRRISEIAPSNATEERWLKPEDVAGKDLVLTHCIYAQGAYGTYLQMHLEDVETGKSIVVATGAKYVMQQIDQLKLDEDLPILVKFTQVGRSWKLE